MLDERKNRVKNKREFKDWLDMESEIEKKEYFEDNYIPLDVSYDIKDFDEFYNKRKELLIIALKKILLGAKDEQNKQILISSFKKRTFNKFSEKKQISLQLDLPRIYA